MLLAVLPGLVLAMWGLGALFDWSEDESEEEEPFDPENTLGGGTFSLGDGDDTFLGTEWSDTIHAGQGDDVVLGGGESLTGVSPDFGESDDKIYLGAGDDIFGDPSNANYGNDLVRGGAGNDTISVQGFGDSTVYGDLGDDHIDALDIGFFAEADTVYGGDGNDVIYADEKDIIEGGAGDDRFVLVDDDCYGNGSIVITDYEQGDMIEVHVEYHPNPGLQTITPELTSDGQSQIIPSTAIWSQGQSIILLGSTDLEAIDVIVHSALDEPSDFPCD